MGNNITGKIVVITGASSGLGEATERPRPAYRTTMSAVRSITHMERNCL